MLQALKDGMKPMFTWKTDIYSFTMVCSEILKGCTSFQGHHLSDYDLVLSGKRPSFLHIGTNNGGSYWQAVGMQIFNKRLNFLRLFIL